MKKIASILVVAIAFTFTTQAQKGPKKMKESDFSVEQQTTLAVKKLTLALDLSDAQQRQIKPVIAEKIADKKANFQNRKEGKKDRKKLSADERYAKQNQRLDKEIAMQNKMKRILNDEQYSIFKKMKKNRGKDKMKKGKKALKEGNKKRILKKDN